VAKRIVSLGLGGRGVPRAGHTVPILQLGVHHSPVPLPLLQLNEAGQGGPARAPGGRHDRAALRLQEGGSGSIVCPVCKKALAKEGKDYRTVGVWYGCLSCGKQFDTPKNTYLCLSCSKEFTTQELVISSVNKVTIDKAVLDDFSKRHFILRPLLSVIAEVGYEPASPGTMTGKSGYQHSFSAIGKDKDGKVYAFEIAVGNPQVEESAILNMFAKVLDTQPAKSYIICMPSLNINGKKIAGVYGIEVVEGGVNGRDIQAPEGNNYR